MPISTTPLYTELNGSIDCAIQNLITIDHGLGVVPNQYTIHCTDLDAYDVTFNLISKTPTQIVFEINGPQQVLNWNAVITRNHSIIDGITNPAQVSYSTSGETANGSPGYERWLKQPQLSGNRGWSSVALLPNGKVLIAGGVGAGIGNAGISSGVMGAAGPKSSAVIWDPATGQTTPAADMPNIRSAGAAFPLPGGKVLVCCGFAGGGVFSPNLTSCIYDSLTDTWATVGAVGGTKHQCCDPIPACIIKGGLHDGDPFVAGGMGFEDGNPNFFFGGLDTSKRFDVGSSTWVVTADMSRRRAYSALVALGGGKVLAVCGISSAAQPLVNFHPDAWTETCEVYDADADTWTAVDPLPVIAGETVGAYSIAAPGGSPAGYQARRMIPVGVRLAEGKALIAGGFGPLPAGVVPARPRSACWIFDINRAPGTQWRQTSSLACGRAWGKLLPLGSEFIACGGVDEIYSPGSYVTEIFDPITETWRQSADTPKDPTNPSAPVPGGRPSGVHTGFYFWQATETTQGKVLMVGGAHHPTTGGWQDSDDIAACRKDVSLFSPGAPAVPSLVTPPGSPVAPASVDARIGAYLNEAF